MIKKSGVTLVMVAGVLAVLAALGAGFYTLMFSQTKAAARYSDSVRADLLAQGGVQDAIGRLHEQAYLKTEDPTDSWYTVDWLNNAQKKISFASFQPSKFKPGSYYPPAFTRALGNSVADDSDRYLLNVSDAAGKINVNACDNLGVLLDNLCRVIGPPLTAADLDMIQPARWVLEGASGGDYGRNKTDTVSNLDIYHVLDENGKGTDPVTGYPVYKTDGTPIYGDGYAIAAYRSRHGLFQSIFDVKQALTIKHDPVHPELEQLQRETKFNALRDYITVDSWVDTDTVCVGKFEWVNSAGKSVEYADPNGPSAVSSGKLTIKKALCQILIDRDKSWVADDPNNDPQNKRGSLRGSYVSIMNGHGSGQIRRIATNGSDWIAIENSTRMYVEPGPISSYMIVAREDALVDKIATQYGTISFPRVDGNGRLVDDPDIDYSARPLCIHRAPININTASEKVLTALFLGIDVQHGHFSAVATDADLALTSSVWIDTDPHHREGVVLKPRGLKRVPASPGKIVLNRPRAWPASDNSKFDYICNYGSLAAPAFATASSGASGIMTEAHELAYRIVIARQRTLDAGTGLPIAPGKWDGDPNTAEPTASGNVRDGYDRGPFRSWDDLYFRVVKPWDDIRSFPIGEPVPYSGKQRKTGLGKASVARVIMAHFNSNTDILKFNPNIEWIDRWGRNFTEMEAVMVYTDIAPHAVSANGFSTNGHAVGTTIANPVDDQSYPIFALESGFGGKVLGVPGAPNTDQGAYIIRSYRYKSDELIDKTDMNRSTTEFSFDSNGIYDIQSIGQVVKGGEVISEKRIDVLVKVYDVWRESTQRQFVNGTFSEAANQSLAFAGDTGNYSGTIARDANPRHSNVRLALTTQPEPLVPVHFTLAKKGPTNRPNLELVDSTFRDAYGNARTNPYGGGGSGADVPDVLANRILPAGYDGQIVLATNTLSYDPATDRDSFLASFDGDLDSTTCMGNGREQAKTPNNSKIRVVDTIGLLGLLNDTEVDTDVSLTGKNYKPGAAPDPNGVKVYPFNNVRDAMVGLDYRPLAAGRTPYWENVMGRMGDLRSDGVFLSGPGVAGNDATLKYLVGEASKGKDAHENFQLNDNDGTTISMWAKTTWHWNDNRTHEFFNCVNPGNGSRAEACYIVKDGRVKWCNLGGTTFGISDAGSRNNDFGFIFEGRNTQGIGDWSDPDYPVYLHGGYTGVPETRLHQYTSGQPNTPESAAYRIQPFRWHYLGGKINYGPLNKIYSTGSQTDQTSYSIPRITDGGSSAGQQKEGYLTGNNDVWADAESIDMAYQAGYWIRPFIDSERYPEAKNFVPPAGSMKKGGVPDTLKYKYWGCWQIQGAKPWASKCAAGDWYDYEMGVTPGTQSADCHTEGGIGQPLAWPWADGFKPNGPRVFSINNLNLGDPTNYTAATTSGSFYNIYRHLIEDGTYAVIDEFKISNRTSMLGDATDRVVREQSTSRYYLPANPSSDAPYYTSQTLLESLKGAGVKATPTNVIVARVTWTVFTPRFMHEYKVAEGTQYARSNQYLTKMGNAANNPGTFTIPFKGPFDYDVYNDDDMISGAKAQTAQNGRLNRYASVARPYPHEYTANNGQSHSTRGVQIQILNDTAPIAGAREQHRGQADFVTTSTFIDPDVENRLGSVGQPAVVQAGKLRYKVSFVYPIDPLADPKGGTNVNPGRQYLLDTPVFDDISITYFTRPRILMYRLVNE